MTDTNKFKSNSKKRVPFSGPLLGGHPLEEVSESSESRDFSIPLKSPSRTYQSKDLPTILFLSKRGMSRSPLAQEVMRNLIRQSSLFGRMRVSSRGVNVAYNDCPIDGRMQSYCSKLGLILHRTALFATVPEIANASLIITMDADSEDFVKIHKHAIRGEVRSIGGFLATGSEPYVQDPFDRDDETDVDERYEQIISTVSSACAKLLHYVPRLIL